MNIHASHSGTHQTISFAVAFTSTELGKLLQGDALVRFHHLYARGRHREALLIALKAVESGPGTSEQRACARNPTEKTENGGNVGATKDDQHYLG